MATAGTGPSRPALGMSRATAGAIATARLRELFACALNPQTGRRYSCADVAAHETHLSEADVRLLEAGRVDNPTGRQIEALARFFNVAPITFFDAHSQSRLREDLATVDRLGLPVAARTAVLQLTGQQSRCSSSPLTGGVQ